MRVFYKLAIISGLTILLLIPLLLIEQKISERAYYRNAVKSEIAQTWTGRQLLAGPFLMQPYVLRTTVQRWDGDKKQTVKQEHLIEEQVLIAPTKLTIRGQLFATLRQRGIYQVPVYTAHLDIKGEFDDAEFAEIRQREGFVRFKSPRLFVHVQDNRGIENLSSLHWNAETLEFISGTDYAALLSGVHAILPDNSAAVGDFAFTLTLRGMDEFAVTPSGEDTYLQLSADWPHPKFAGRHLPNQHRLREDGFSAEWRLNHFATDIKALVKQCGQGVCTALLQSHVDVGLLQPVDNYLQAERSVKYALLFMVLIFSAYFLFEVLQGFQIHPLQYLLVGFSLAIFYLLLIALSEHIDFAHAYLTAAGACVSLSGFYSVHVFKNYFAGFGFALGLAMLYGLLYMIISAEDYALLMGSILLFSVLTTIMYVTRHIDWYALEALRKKSGQPLCKQADGAESVA